MTHIFLKVNKLLLLFQKDRLCPFLSTSAYSERAFLSSFQEAQNITSSPHLFYLDSALRMANSPVRYLKDFPVSNMST